MPESGKSSVMVVDDTPANIDLLVEILGEDYDVRIALDGPSALEDIAEEAPDLVLLDIMMPGMDGYEVCRQLKENAATRDIPVIFVTAKVAVGDEVRGFDCGGVDYITKPVSAPVVQARVAAHLALRQASRILGQRNRALEENIRLREEVERISRHDLKTPLNKIISLPRILAGGDQIPARCRDALKTIEQSGLTMLEMINRSLDMVKMENRTYALKPEPVDLTGVVDRVVSDLREQALEKGCVFRVETEEGTPQSPVLSVSGEDLLCYSMAANLVRNALEACPENAAVSIRISRAGESNAEFLVQNPGMVPEPVRDCFFDKYATAGKKGGTGLGTYSARLMAQTMGGEIAMTTGPEQGTMIRVTLPLAEKRILPETVPAWQGDPADVLLPELRVLIADDDPDNLSILAALLDHASLEVDRAGNGQQAFDLWKGVCHDLVFMDVEMPEMDGMTAVRQIREAETREARRIGSGRATGVFALSAHGRKMAEACADAGFDGYLTKPVSRAGLFGTIQDWLDQEKNFDGTRESTWENDTLPVDEVEIDGDLEEIFPAFLENKAGQIRELEHCIAVSDLEGVRRTAHKLKGGFNMYGIRSLGSLCGDIERAAVSGANERIGLLGPAVSRKFERLKIVYR